MDRNAASQHRQALLRLREERNAIEEELLASRELLRGSLIAHRILAGGHRRSQPAYYLYRVDSGRRRMVYIKKADLEKARREAEAYRRFQDGLHRLRKLSREILGLFKKLRESGDTL